MDPSIIPQLYLWKDIMSDPEVIDLSQRYLRELSNAGDVAKEAGGDLPHAAWMCSQIPGFVRDGKRSKADRWLGWVQCMLYHHGRYSLGDMKRHNSPAD